MAIAYDKLIDVDRLTRFKTKQDAYNGQTYLGIDATAAKASRLANTQAVGHDCKPVYFTLDGVPAACKYELNASVPANAKFTDTTYEDVVAGATKSGLMTGADKTRLDGIADGAQANVLEGVQINGTDLAISGKKVNITTATGSANGTVSINGSDVAVKGLDAAAYKGLATNGVADGDTGLVTADEVYDAINTSLTTVMSWKGVKATKADLPTTGNKAGDVWHVTADNSEYAWDGTDWEELGLTFDPTGYVTTADIALAGDSDIDAMFTA